MEYGYKNPNGLKYSWLKKEVEKKIGEPLSPDAEYAFIDWVSEYFSCTDFEDLELNNKLRWIKHHLLLSSGNVERFDSSYKAFNNAYWVMKGITTKQYLDYLELKESRKNAKWATIFAILSILIATVAIGIGAYQSAKAPKPPFEVRVIEDKSGMNELEKENKQLKDSLYEAKLLIAVYESE